MTTRTSVFASKKEKLNENVKYYVTPDYVWVRNRMIYIGIVKSFAIEFTACVSTVVATY